LPPYVLSAAYWIYIENTDQELSRATAGFIRTYSYLIQYEQDFKKAQKLELIPEHDGQKEITYDRFAKFIAPFTDLTDSEVSSRYQYGELRLTRLNALAPILFRKLIFHHVNGQWGPLLSQLFAWMLGAFVWVGTVLAAMQTELAVKTLSSNLSNGWKLFAQVSRWVSVVILITSALMLLLFIAVVMFLFVHDIYFARSLICLKQKKEEHISKFKSGVV
jgi:hypothetical protein